MKNSILVALMAILISTVAIGQNQFIQNSFATANETSIGNVVVKSKIKLEYDSRFQKSDTIYVSIQNWSYNTNKVVFSAQISDYVKEAGKYKKINTKNRSYTISEINSLFVARGNPMLIAESYTTELIGLLKSILLNDTKEILTGTGKTIYGGLVTNWEAVSQ